jgi:hypothetical protein
MIDSVAEQIHRVYVKVWWAIACWWLISLVIGAIMIHAAFLIVGPLQALIMVLFAWIGRVGITNTIKQCNHTILLFQKPVLLGIRVILMGIGYGGLLVLPVLYVLMATGVIPGKEEMLTP